VLPADAIVHLEGLCKAYAMGKERLPVLKDLSLTVKQGELISIMGSSGSGKSTLLNILGLLDDYDAGRYFLAGKLVERLSEREAAIERNQTLGFVFQSFNLLPYKTAVENVALPLFYRGIPRKVRNRMALQYLERVQLADRADHLPTELSGGQKQRVAIARALVTNPKLVLADEPTGALDTETSYALMDLFRSINREGVSMIIVTHEHDIAERTDRTIILRDGRVESHGTTPEPK
jgi:putative ABC transport system ATP-binding protein